MGVLFLILKKRSTFFRESLILIISNLATGLLRFIFSIILSQKLQAEGMGLYGLIMPIYDLFTCLINGGMIAALSKTSAIYSGKDDYDNLHKSVKVALTFDIIWAIIIVSLVFINSPYISKYIIKDSRCTRALIVMCPAMIFIALSSILKGYFYGISKSKVPSIIDISEKAFRVLVFLFILNLFNIKSVENTVTATYATLTFGEFTSFAFLYLFYLKDKRSYNFTNYKSEDSIQLLFDILIISIPLCINGFLTTILSTISTLIVPRRLMSLGINYNTALSMIGKFSNMASSIPLFPIIILTSICTILIPNLSESLNKNDYFSIENKILKVLKISIILSLATVAVCVTIPNELGYMFFKRNDLKNYIIFLSFCTPFAYISVVSYAILNGMGKQKILLKNSIIISIEDVILLYVLTGIPSINIYSCGISLILTSITSIILNFKEITKQFFIDLTLFNTLIYILNSIFVFFILNIEKNIINLNNVYIKNSIIIISGFLIMFILSSITHIKSKK